MDAFEVALNFVLKWEGGYVNDPRDSGGETKFGISKKAYPNLDIKNLTQQQAGEIYRSDYWEKAGCEGISTPLNLVVFDTAVNCGVKKAGEMLKFCGGEWVDYLFLRVAHYVSLNKSVYLRGWLNRVIDLYKLCRLTSRVM